VKWLVTTVGTLGYKVPTRLPYGSMHTRVPTVLDQGKVGKIQYHLFSRQQERGQSDGLPLPLPKVQYVSTSLLRHNVRLSFSK